MWVLELAKDFEPPTEKDLLRFRYTTYLGENHPAESKVVVEFAPHTIPGLSPVSVRKLIKLAGVRYNPDKRIVKMSCEQYEHQAQNKRHLQRLVNRLIKEAKVRLGSALYVVGDWMESNDGTVSGQGDV
jgi:small subunit ribosomal protein S35